MKLFEDDYKEHWFDRKIGRAFTNIILTVSIVFFSALMSGFELSKASVLFAVLTFISISLQVLFSIRCTLIKHVNLVLKRWLLTSIFIKNCLKNFNHFWTYNLKV